MQTDRHLTGVAQYECSQAANKTKWRELSKTFTSRRGTGKRTGSLNREMRVLYP